VNLLTAVQQLDGSTNLNMAASLWNMIPVLVGLLMVNQTSTAAVEKMILEDRKVKVSEVAKELHIQAVSIKKIFFMRNFT